MMQIFSHGSKSKIAVATVIVASAIKMFFSQPNITEDELLAYINQLTGYDDSLTNLVCFMFYAFIQDAANERVPAGAR